jgi:tetratricopeptide (TPR) repeat protein
MPNSTHLKNNFKSLSKLCLSLLLVTLFCWASLPAFAQDEDPQNEQKRSEPDQTIERIVVDGSNLDSAMRAFNLGDYAQAEIEFKKNAKCALRIERNKRAFVDGLQIGSVNQAIESSVNTSSNPNGQGGGNSAPAAGSFSGAVGGGNSNAERTQAPTRTCDNRALQLYMVGLSQIQLGRADEAEANFKTATFLNRNLYDAQFRLALMQILRSDMKGARSQFKKLEKILKRCKDCPAREEIIVRKDYLEKALSGEVDVN